jgi:hypothetical protein
MLSESKYIKEFSDVYLMSSLIYLNVFISIYNFRIIKIIKFMKIVKILFFLESDNFLKQK